MDARAHQAISNSITAKQISGATNYLSSRFGRDLAEEAVAEALVRVCQHFDPEHTSGATAATYFRSVAEMVCLELLRKSAHEIATDPQSMPEPAPAELDLAWLSTMHMVDLVLDHLVKEQFAWDNTPARTYNIKVARQILPVLVEMLDESDGDFGAGERNNLYVALGTSIGKSPRVVANAVMELRSAALAVLPNECRAVSRSKRTDWRCGDREKLLAA
jgi:DNA-directed RNA polymerase specialized sigma24 family protein